MPVFEYKVVPAPYRGEKAKGAKTTADRFAQALSTVMNDLGRDGWEYLRADTLPCEERVGLTGKTSTFQHMLVFRRTVAAGRMADPEAAERAPVQALTTRVVEGMAPPVGKGPETGASGFPVLGPARGDGVAAE